MRSMWSMNNGNLVAARVELGVTDGRLDAGSVRRCAAGRRDSFHYFLILVAAAAKTRHR